MKPFNSFVRTIAFSLIVTVGFSEPALMSYSNTLNTTQNNLISFVPPRRTGNALNKSELRAIFTEGKPFQLDQSKLAPNNSAGADAKSELRTKQKNSGNSLKIFLVSVLSWLGLGLLPSVNPTIAQTQNAAALPLTAPIQYPRSYSNPYDPYRMEPMDLISTLSNPFSPLHPLNRDRMIFSPSERNALHKLLPEDLYIQIIGSAYSALPSGLSGRTLLVRDEDFYMELRHYFESRRVALGGPLTDYLLALLEPPLGRSSELDRNWMRDSLDILEAMMMEYYSRDEAPVTDFDRFLAMLTLMAKHDILEVYDRSSYGYYSFTFDKAVSRALRTIKADPELKSARAFFSAIAINASVHRKNLNLQKLLKGLYETDTHIKESSPDNLKAIPNESEAATILNGIEEKLNVVMHDASRDVYFRLAASYYLLQTDQYRDQAREFLTTVLNSKLSEHDRWLALTAMSRDQNQESNDVSVGGLKKLMNNASPVIRVAAASSLARIGNQEGIDFLKAAYKNPKLGPEERVNAAAALVSLGIDMANTVSFLEEAQFLPVFNDKGEIIFNSDLQNLFNSIDNDLLPEKNREILLKNRLFLKQLAANHSNPAIRAMATNRLLLMNLILGSEIGAAGLALVIAFSSPYWFPKVKERYDRRQRMKKWENALAPGHKKFLQNFYSSYSESTDEVMEGEIPKILEIKQNIRFRNFTNRTKVLNGHLSDELIPVLADEAKFLWHQFLTSKKPSLRAEAYAGVRDILIALLSFEKTTETRKAFLDRIMPIILARPVEGAQDERILANALSALNITITSAIHRIENPSTAPPLSEVLPDIIRKRNEKRSELRRTLETAETPLSFKSAFAEADQILSTAANSSLRQIFSELFQIRNTQKLNSTEAIILTRALVANPDQTETLGLALRKLAKTMEQKIYVIAPDEVSRMVVNIANQPLDQAIQIEIISDWPELGKYLLRDQISFAHVITSDDERDGIESVLKRELPVELQNSFAVQSVRSSDIAGILTAAGLTQVLLEKFQAALRTAYAA